MRAVKVLKYSIFATALAFAPVVVSAATIDLTLEYKGKSVSGPTFGTTIDAAPVTPASGSTPFNVAAYGFNMEGTNGIIGNFLAWCLDVEHWLGGINVAKAYFTETKPYSSTFPFTSSYGLNSVQMGRVQSVFEANYGGLDATDGLEAAGFQVAIWNALYEESDGSGDWLAGTGQFQVVAGSVLNQANNYLQAAKIDFTSGGSSFYNLTFLESKTGNQNLVTADPNVNSQTTPVPLPATAFLLFSAIGGIGLVGRRRRKQA